MAGERGSQWSGAVTRNIVILVAASFITAAGFSAANLLLPYYIMALLGILKTLPEKLAAISASRVAIDVGGLVTAFMAARAFVAAASGWLSDRFGRKPMIVAGLGLYTLSQLAYYFSTSLWEIYLVRVVQGVASAMTWPVAEALIMDSVPPAVRTRAMSLYVISFNLGNVVGPLLGSAAYAVAKGLLGPGASVVDVFRYPFLLLAVVAAATFLLSPLVREPGHMHVRGVIGRGFRGGLRDLPAAVRRALIGFYSNALVNGIAVGIVSSVMIIYIIEFIAKTPETVGMLMAVPALFGIAVGYPAARKLDHIGSEAVRKRILIGAMAASRLLLMTVGYIRSVLLFVVVAAALNALMNIMLPLLRSIEGGLVPPRLRGRVFGLHQGFFNIGMAFGPLLGAWIYQHYHDRVILPGVTGVEATFILAGALGLAALPLIAVYYQPALVGKAWAEAGRGAGARAQ